MVLARMTVISQGSPIRLAIGPSPWGFRNRSVTVAGLNYQFRETVPGDSKLSGLTSIQDSNGETLLILDFYDYVRILDDGHVLLWRESTEAGSRRIIFDSFLLASLKIVSDPIRIAFDIREKKLGAAPLPSSDHWEFCSLLEPGRHRFSIPHDWSRFEETLVLADHLETTVNTPARAIFAFDWNSHLVQVFPQDWFNSGDYDFGYQWITRAWRRSDGAIMGEGIRLGSFELDRTNRQVKTWLVRNPFYMIQ